MNYRCGYWIDIDVSTATEPPSRLRPVKDIDHASYPTCFNGHGTAISIAPLAPPGRSFGCNCFNGHGTAISIAPGSAGSQAAPGGERFNGHGTAISIAPRYTRTYAPWRSKFQRPRNGHLDSPWRRLVDLDSPYLVSTATERPSRLRPAAHLNAGYGTVGFQRPRNGHLDCACETVASVLAIPPPVSTATERPSRLRLQAEPVAVSETAQVSTATERPSRLRPKTGVVGRPPAQVSTATERPSRLRRVIAPRNVNVGLGFNGHGTAISIAPRVRQAFRCQQGRRFNGHGTAISIAPRRQEGRGDDSERVSTATERPSRLRDTMLVVNQAIANGFQRPRNGHLDCARQAVCCWLLFT